MCFFFVCVSQLSLLSVHDEAVMIHSYVKRKTVRAGYSEVVKGVMEVLPDLNYHEKNLNSFPLIQFIENSWQ